MPLRAQILSKNLYAAEVDCLGHMINDRGLHADTDKLAKIHNWRVP